MVFLVFFYLLYIFGLTSVVYRNYTSASCLVGNRSTHILLNGTQQSAPAKLTSFQRSLYCVTIISIVVNIMNRLYCIAFMIIAFYKLNASETDPGNYILRQIHV